jgi:uncharacterized protein (DUF1800 family)
MVDDPAAVAHVLRRWTWGPREGEAEAVAQQGLAAWVAAQFDPASLDESALSALLPPDPTPPPAFASMQAARQFGRALVRVMTERRFLTAVHGARQVEAVLVDFWFNHFNVFASKGLVGLYLPAYERDVIRPRVLGRFRDLLGAVAHAPSMLIYLDNFLSVGAASPGGRGRGLNENYARELLELHTLGVDGPYTQADVVAVARAFTGWTVDLEGGQFTFAAASHDAGPKVVLGVPLAGGGEGEGEQVLDLLAVHPATARHLATKLARRFVLDDPPASLVDLLAARYLESGGDLHAMTTALIQAPNFADPAVRFRKFKTPLDFMLSLFRATGAPLPDARGLAARLDELGMAPYQCLDPTGYADEAQVWLSPGSIVARMNAILQYVGTPVPAVAGTPEFQYR